jgi:hypothetical protein
VYQELGDVLFRRAYRMTYASTSMFDYQESVLQKIMLEKITISVPDKEGQAQEHELNILPIVFICESDNLIIS